MTYEPGARQRPSGPPPERRGGGVPDGLLVGGVLLLISLAMLTWSSTELGGLVAHGRWPEGVAFVDTGTAVRSFLTAPAEVAEAWPNARADGLPSGTMLWLAFLAQLVVLFSSALWIAFRVASWRARRADRAGRAERGETPDAAPSVARPRGRVNDGFPAATEAAEHPGSHARRERREHGGYEGSALASGPEVPLHDPAAGSDGVGAAGRPAGVVGADGTAADAPRAGGGHVPPGPGSPDAAGPPADVPAEAPVDPRAGGLVGYVAGASGNGRGLLAEVTRAPEGLVVIDPDGRLWTRTARQRGKVGPVHVYDPGHATDAPVRLRWAPQRGCEDMTVARRRAAALLAPVRPTEPVFQLDAEAAETLLRCYLHAAALAGEPIQQVLRWTHGAPSGHGRAAAEPGKILRGNSRVAPGASMELESTLTTHPGRRDAGLALIGRALAGLDQLHIRQSCSPGRVDALSLDNVSGEGGTLYVVGDHQETAGLRGALVEAVTTDQPGLAVIDAGQPTR